MRICLFLIILSILSCNKNKSIYIDEETIAKGDINTDIIFDGKIKFFNAKTGLLIRESIYSNGVLNGEQTDYYPNGKIMTISNYENNKQNGYTYTFDSVGGLQTQDFFFYDIKTGSSIEYTNSVVNYWFYSLDNTILFNLSYDSLSLKKKITELQSEYFFFNKRVYSDLTQKGISSKKEELFIYTPNPPKYNFRYSLVSIDSQYKNEITIKTFDSTKPWSVILLDDEIKNKTIKKIAIKLLVYEPLLKGDITMFKFL